jgi:hypothetical protein
MASDHSSNVLQTGTYLNREDVLQKVVDILNKQIEEAKSRAQGKDYAPVVILQPWVPLFWKDSEARGGNVLGLERFDENMFSMQPSLSPSPSPIFHLVP